MTAPEHMPKESPDRKAMLFCPVCGYEAPPDGDWTVTIEADSGRAEYGCPDCSHTVLSQPRFDGADTAPAARTMPGALLQLVNAVVRHDVL